MATRIFIKPEPNKSFSTLEFDDLDNEVMLNYAATNGYVEFQKPLTLEDPEGWFARAYEYDPEAKKVTINLDKAKNGYMEFLKEARSNKLKELDALQLRYLVQKNEKKVEEIEEIKIALRDMPETIPMDKIKNVFELVHLFPPILLPDE
jgi:hypothetical protein